MYYVLGEKEGFSSDDSSTGRYPTDDQLLNQKGGRSGPLGRTIRGDGADSCVELVRVTDF